MKEYEDYLEKQRKLIREQILNKSNVKNFIPLEKIKVGKSKRTGGRNNKDTKLRDIAEVFGLSVDTLRHWKYGSFKTGRQRLFMLLYSLDAETLQKLKNISEKQKDE